MGPYLIPSVSSMKAKLGKNTENIGIGIGNWIGIGMGMGTGLGMGLGT